MQIGDDLGMPMGVTLCQGTQAAAQLTHWRTAQQRGLHHWAALQRAPLPADQETAVVVELVAPSERQTGKGGAPRPPVPPAEWLLWLAPVAGSVPTVASHAAAHLRNQ